MTKQIITLSMVSLFFINCAELQGIANHLPNETTQGIEGVSNVKIANGLKQALEIGVQDGVNKLSKKDGFWADQATRILLPKELKNVEKTLRNFGLGNLADEGVKLLNRAAEDAVIEAAPIFKDAIMSMTFDDAKEILLGPENAATQYLEKKTNKQLFNAFEPKVKQSLNKVGANKIWEQIFKNYNRLSDQDINTDLNAYVTEQAIGSVFNMVKEKEIGIRNNIGLRTTPLLKEVFALQDDR